VPPGNYTQLQLFGLSTEGSTTIDVTLTYADTTTTTATYAIADWFGGTTADQFVLVNGLMRIDNTNLSAGGVDNRPIPGINGTNTNPNSAKQLVSVKIANTGGGFFVFYGATAY